ncbi:integrase catalytic domain-containing protein [Salipiger aestuarii]|uniref:integrase catalytic domain-containing protein n=1 Tax=Salipiger aestuarii TaxID=568098 RepID=UPI00123B0B9C|nr:DDE-type integrase/transposase/recombinase [Salipiger aestuarii]
MSNSTSGRTTDDAITLMAEGGLFHHLTDEEKKALGLDKKKARWWITVAICCATRCIVGLVVSRQPNSQSALRVIEMMMRDKGVWGDACGALTPWNQFGWPSVIVTDCASYNISSLVQARVSDLGITLQYCAAANPESKGRIERMFGTFATQLMPRLSGRNRSSADVLSRWAACRMKRPPRGEHAGRGMAGQRGVRRPVRARKQGNGLGRDSRLRMCRIALTVRRPPPAR